MKKIFLLLFLLCFATPVFAAKLPDGIQSTIKKAFPSADIRFDGVIILPDGTIYLPLYPAKIKSSENLKIVTTYPENLSLAQKPDVAIFSDDFVLLKVIVNKNGTKTIKKFDKPPAVIKTGLLPQDLLIPKNLIIPENMKSILGILNIKLEPEDEIKVAPATMEYETSKVNNVKPTNKVSSIPQLKDKLLYVSTTYSKDIQVIMGENKNPTYALAQKTIPCCIKLTPDNKFLFVTTYNSPLVDIISLADDRIIKELDLSTNADEIVMDAKNNCAYISSPDASMIYQVSLSDMSLKKKIKINGRCEKLNLCNDYLLYVDKYSNKIWSIEFNNDYTLRHLGGYPNISKILYYDGYVYVSSRTKNRIAIIDYVNQTLFSEIETINKPMDMFVYNKKLYVLGAQDNVIQKIDTITCEPVSTIKIGTKGFATSISSIPNTLLAIISDAKSGKYYVIDFSKDKIIKTNVLDIPAHQIIVGKNIRKI